MQKWGEIKNLLTSIAPSSVGEIATPGDLINFAHLANMAIASCPHKFRSLIRNGELTLTTATEYNLAVTFPDISVPFQFHGDEVSGRELGYRGLAQFNISTGGVSMTIRGKTLLIKNPPVAGSVLQVPYFSNHLVLDEDTTTRKLKFVGDDDTTILYDNEINMLIEGVMDYIQRREDSNNNAIAQVHDGRIASISRFDKAKQEAILNDTPIDRSIFDFRFLTP